MPAALVLGRSLASGGSLRFRAATAVEASSTITTAGAPFGIHQHALRACQWNVTQQQQQQQRSYSTVKGDLSKLNASFSRPPSSAASSPTDPEDLFDRTFGATPGRHSQQTPSSPLQAEALFGLHFDTSASHASGDRQAFQALPPSTSSGKRRSTQTSSTPWSGLWNLLAGGRYAGLPFSAAAEAARLDDHQRSLDAASSSFPSNATRDNRAAPSPHASSRSSAAPPSPPPTAAVRRYQHSYRHWQWAHQRVQQEGGVLEGMRSEMRRIKAAQRAYFQAQLRSTTRWTLFVVMPLLTALWVSIFFDSMLYRSEVLRLQFVDYAAALREYEEANAKEQGGKGWKGRRNGTAKKKKSEVRID